MTRFAGLTLDHPLGQNLAYGHRAAAPLLFDLDAAFPFGWSLVIREVLLGSMLMALLARWPEAGAVLCLMGRSR